MAFEKTVWSRFQPFIATILKERRDKYPFLYDLVKVLENVVQTMFYLDKNI